MPDKDTNAEEAHKGNEDRNQDRNEDREDKERKKEAGTDTHGGSSTGGRSSVPTPWKEQASGGKVSWGR